MKGEMKDNGRYSKPGDRGDASNSAGLAKIKSGYAGNLKTDSSKGYESVTGGWGGNVRR